MSRFQEKLIAEIQDSRTPTAQAIARLRLSMYLSRTGRVVGANEVICAVRDGISNSGDHRVLGLLNIAESILAFFSDDYDLAFEKSRRAEAICSVSGRPEATTLLALAWRAHYEALSNNWPSVIQMISRILASPSLIDSDTMARTAMVMANALIEMDDNASADVWYGIARRCAQDMGDDSTIEASIFNRAAARVQNLRLQQVDGTVSEFDLAAIDTEVGSAVNYCQHTGIQSIQWMLDVLRAQVALLQGNHSVALSILTGNSLNSLKRPELNAERQIGIILCRAVLGIDHATESVLVNLEKAAREFKLNSDKALQYYLLSQCHSSEKRVDAARESMMIARKCIEEYRDYQNIYRGQLQRLRPSMN